MTYEPYEHSDSLAEVIARDIEARLDTGRFIVEPQCAEWLDEYRSFDRRDQKIPHEGFPLMTATHIACAMFDEWARPERHPDYRKVNHPNLAVV